MRTKNHRTAWPIKIAVVLLYLVIVTLPMVSGLYARYTSSDSGEDASRVASFHVTVENDFYSEDLMLSLAPGTEKKEVKVTNDSEVSVNTYFEVENKTLNLPLEFLVYPKENKPTDAASVRDKYTHVETLKPQEEIIYVVEIIWPQENALEDMGKVDLINLSIRVVQMD